MQAKTFIEILADELRGELRKEIRAEFEAELGSQEIKVTGHEFVAQIQKSAVRAEQVQLWLNLKMGGAIASPSAKKSAYGAQRPANSASPQPTAIRHLPSAQTKNAEPQVKCERTGSAKTIEQTFALEFFKREGAAIESNFTESQLKSEFRKIALRIHPDRHADASSEQLRSYSSRFQTLVESTEILEATLT